MKMPRNGGHFVPIHGMFGTPTYKTWAAMKERCANKNSASWKYYGARGITFCKRWIRFENFLADMGEKPRGMTLGRKDNDGPYSPQNCEWQTLTQQNRNYSRNRKITFRGKTMVLMDWAKSLGVSWTCLYNRIERGWPLEYAMTTKANAIKSIAAALAAQEAK